MGNKIFSIFLSKGHDTTTESGRSNERLRRIGHTALASACSRAINILSGLITVPITLSYLGAEQFGLWMTLTGFVAFLSFTDMGLGIGLQNALTTCHGKDDRVEPRRLISTTLILLCLICLILCGFAWYLLPYLPLQSLVKVHSKDAIDVLLPTTQAIIIVFGCSLPLGIIQRILDAYQEGFLSNVMLSIGRLLGFASIFLCIDQGFSLPIMTTLYMGLPFVFIAFSGLFIFWKRPWLRPGIRSIQFSKAKQVSRVGGLALLAQLGASIMTTGPLFLLSSQYGAQAVAPFAITQRMLGGFSMVLSVAMSPLWPAYGEAQARGDIGWIKKTFFRSVKVSAIIVFPIFIITALSGLEIIEWWISEKKTLPSWSLLMACNVWMVFMAWNRVCSMMLNGLNKFKGQSIYGIVLPIIAIGSGYYVSLNNELPITLWVVVLIGEVFRSILFGLEAIYVLRRMTKILPEVASD
jgi:O-antigen/teichoic acid export membrane protein